MREDLLCLVVLFQTHARNADIQAGLETVRNVLKFEQLVEGCDRACMLASIEKGPSAQPPLWGGGIWHRDTVLPHALHSSGRLIALWCRGVLAPRASIDHRSKSGVTILEETIPLP